MTSQNQIPDDDLLEKWLDAPMTEEKKQEMEKYREEWEKSRKEAIEHKKNNEYWKFLVSDWWEQGCGRTFFLMMTQAHQKVVILIGMVKILILLSILKKKEQFVISKKCSVNTLHKTYTL
jgi:hypothetical protein